MSDPKFYKITFTVEVLSEQPISTMDLSELHIMTDTGDCVGRTRQTSFVEMSGKEAAVALYEFGSEPGFFMLDDEGNYTDPDTT